MTWWDHIRIKRTFILIAFMERSSGLFFQRYARKDPQVYFVLGAYMVELQVMTGKGHREISFELNGYRQSEFGGLRDDKSQD
jgi:hypothetical protein